jgi:N-acetylglucosamine-6-phosphate deacetylase
VTGKILRSQELFYDPDETIDLKGRILSPGFIDVQCNGAFGFDFSVVPENLVDFQKGLQRLNRHLVRTGVTSYLPTLPSQKLQVYRKVLKYLGPSGASRSTREGSESLGAHCEGPFIASSKCGIHSPAVLQQAPYGFADPEACYGAENLPLPESGLRSPITMITAVPEITGIMASIPDLSKRGIKFSIGHAEAA